MHRFACSWLLGLLAVGGMVTAAGCGKTETDCDDGIGCVEPAGGSGGGGGSAGTAGSAGTGGTVGDAGDEDVSTGGSGGTGGEAGAGGEDAGDAEAGGSGGEDGGDAEAEPYCDPSLMPDEDPCVIHDDHGVFVSPSGSDTAGCGTMASPCATLGQGMANAKAQDKRVYACGDGGTYDESLTIDVSLDGVTALGGFRCSDWSYEPGTVRTQVQPAGSEAALVVDGVTALEMRDFAFESGDATDPGGSSIAAIVRDTSGVVFVNTTFTAGAGADGVAGASGTKGSDGAVADSPQNGASASCSTVPNVQLGGEWSDPSSCGSQGGFGGTALKSNNGGNGDQGIPLGDDNRGTGGTVVGNEGGAGGVGADGDPGSNGSSAPASGQFASSGYTTADGEAGTNGHTGQGGGGGGASASVANCIGASGGAGGMGGCGGTFGTGGTGGGASVALFIWDSAVTLKDCALTSATGGGGADGGDGGAGGEGQDGGFGGPPGGGMGQGGKGGKGGNGGPGGSGSGGSGGPSYALAYHGGAPTEVGTVSFTAGAGGTKGLGGQAPSGNAAPDGADGESAQRHQVQ